MFLKKLAVKRFRLLCSDLLATHLEQADAEGVSHFSEDALEVEARTLMLMTASTRALSAVSF